MEEPGDDYVSNLAQWLKQPGTPADLKVIHGEKTWEIHRILTLSQSAWFRKALTGHFQEANSGEITLKDDPEYSEAIDCLMSFLYSGIYEDKSEEASDIVAVRVAVLSDKYMVPALFKQASITFRSIVQASNYDATSTQWSDVFMLVYDKFVGDMDIHVQMRDSVLIPVQGHPEVMQALVKDDVILEFLNSNGRAATDLLKTTQSGLHPARAESLILCSRCDYAHLGLDNCLEVVKVTGELTDECPRCGSNVCYPKKGPVRSRFKLNIRCASCGGLHTRNKI